MESLLWKTLIWSTATLRSPSRPRDLSRSRAATWNSTRAWVGYYHWCALCEMPITSLPDRMGLQDRHISSDQAVVWSYSTVTILIPEPQPWLQRNRGGWFNCRQLPQVTYLQHFFRSCLDVLLGALCTWSLEKMDKFSPIVAIMPCMNIWSQTSAEPSQMHQEVVVQGAGSITEFIQHITHYRSAFVPDIPNQMKFPVWRIWYWALHHLITFLFTTHLQWRLTLYWT